MNLYEGRRLTKRFGGTLALNEVSFSLLPGEIHGLCGENGAGKSTLIKILGGILPPGSFSGQLLLNGQPVQFEHVAAARRQGIAIIHQELALVPELSVAENLFLGQEPRQRGLICWKTMHREARQVLTRLGTDLPPDQPVSELGMGSRQMVEIARALIRRMNVLILDEPTTALTEADAHRLHRLLRQLRMAGTGIIYVSHRLGDVLSLCDRITVLRDGKVVATTPAHQLNESQLTEQMVGRTLAQRAAAQTNPGREVLLSVHNLSVREDGRWRLRDVSFEVHRGEVLGIAGLLGAGRSELLHALFGNAAGRCRGVIQLQGRAVALNKPWQAMAYGLALVTEDRRRQGLFPEHGVRENLSVASLSALSRLGIIGPLREHQRNQEMVARLRIKTAGLQQPVLALSGGNQQKVILGRWLLRRPAILLLDEPTRGVDVGVRSELYAYIEQLAQEGVAVLLVSSDMAELLTLSHRIIVLRNGRLVAEFPRHQATPERILQAASAKSQNDALS